QSRHPAFLDARHPRRGQAQVGDPVRLRRRSALRAAARGPARRRRAGRVTGSGRLTGRVALITGAASGIGRATAKRFLAEGARVAAADMNGDALEAEFSGKNGADGADGAITVVGDVSAPVDAARMAAATVEAFGPIDILVNCAGIARYTNFLELPLDEWQLVQDVNSTGTFLMAQAVARHMVDQPTADHSRAIVTIASVEAHIVVASSG